MSQFFITGNGGAITSVQSFIPDTGTSPVVPNGSGQVTIAGGNGIITTGGTNTITFDMESPFTGDFTFRSTTTGDPEIFTIQHTQNTATSDVYAYITCGGTSGGDPYLRYDVPTSTSIVMGINNGSINDPLEIGNGTTMSGSTLLWRMTNVGERTMPLQPAFLAEKANNQSNATGNGTTVTVNYDGTEIFDQNSDYDGTNTFTAPVTGRYYFFAYILINGFTASADNSQFSFNTSNRQYLQWVLAPGKIFNFQNNLSFSIQGFCDMDATDTCFVQAFVNGEGADNLEIRGATNYTYFGGHLVC